MPDRQTLARELATTYAGGRYDDPWAAVEAYREYLDYTAENPDEGSTAVARALEQPRGRIRVWMDGSKPDPARAIEIADQHGWLDVEWDAETFQAVNCLVAWIFAGGSIDASRYAPSFTVDEETESCARTLLQVATDQRPVKRDRDDTRASELTLTSNQTVFGRYLSVLGAPVGEKHDQRRDLALPAYLSGAPEHIRLDFARTYVWHRGTDMPHSDYPIQIREERPESYLRALHQLFASLIDDPVSGDSETYRFREAAAELFSQPPSLCG